MRTAVLQEIIPNGLTYDIDERRTRSERGIPLEVKYTNPLDRYWQKVWDGRRNHGNNIYNRSGVWRFREANNFLGIDTENLQVCSAHLVSLDGSENAAIGPYHLHNAALYIGLDNERAWFLMLNINPSGSFKPGGMVTLFTQGKHLGVNRYICASTGNTAAALSEITANERATPVPYLERCVIVVPRGKTAPGKIVQSMGTNPKLLELDGTFDDCLNKVRFATGLDPTLYVANSYNQFRIEGQKTEMLVAMQAFGWELVPDWVVTPGGNLGSASAVHKAFRELKEYGWTDRMPRLAVVNASAANTLEKLYNERGVRWNNGNVDRGKIDGFYLELREELARRLGHTGMSAIDIHFPAEENLYKTLRALDEMNGVVISVTDDEAWEAKAMIDSNGLGMVDLASAVSVAGSKKLVEKGIIEPHDTLLCRITGADKDPDKSHKYYMSRNPPIRIPNDDAAFLEALYSS